MLRITASWNFRARRVLTGYLICHPYCKMGKVSQNSELVAKSGLDPMALTHKYSSFPECFLLWKMILTYYSPTLFLHREYWEKSGMILNIKMKNNHFPHHLYTSLPTIGASLTSRVAGPSGTYSHWITNSGLDKKHFSLALNFRTCICGSTKPH